MRLLRRRASIAICIGLVIGLSVWGEIFPQAQGTGTVEGTVMDNTGAVLPGASVHIRNTGTNAVRDQVTDERGRYRSVALPPGEYEVTGEMPGFAKFIASGIIVTVGSTATVDLTLPLAAVSQTVDVAGQAPIIEPDRTEEVYNIDEKTIKDLPINGRRWENFVLLSPGVSPDGNFGLVSYRGISGLYNNNTIDGADNNQAFFSEARGRTRAVYTSSQSSIKEFQIGLSNFTAESGRSAGGNVNAVTKSGTNEFHGEGFYFLRDAALTAREPFQPVKPDERRQQFGFSLGGRFIPDKLFFFTTYDQQVRNFPYFVNTANNRFFEVGPRCNPPISCGAVRSFFESLSRFYPRKGNNNIVLFKTDWLATPTQTFMASYNWHRWRAPSGVQSGLVLNVADTANGFDSVKTDTLNLRLTSIINPRTLNEARFQFSRDFESQRPNAPGPGTTVTGGINFGMPNFLPRPAFPNEKRFQWSENFSRQINQHQIKVGLDINYVRDLQINLFQGGGVYGYQNFTNIAQDCPPAAINCTPFIDIDARGVDRTRRHYNSFNQAFDLRGFTGDQAGRIFFTTTDFDLYVQDSFKARNDLTLNLGMRYEFQSLPQPKISNPDFPLTQHFNQDKNNFGPRVGLAWDIGARHKTVARVSYGIYYGRTSNSALAAALTNNGRVLGNYFFNPNSPGAPQYPNVFLTPPPNQTPDVQMFSSDYVRPIIHMADLTIEREVARNLSVSGSYLYSRGQRLPSFRDINLNPPTASVVYELPDGTRTRPFPFFTGPRPDRRAARIILSESVVNSNYNALVLKVVRRFQNHFQLNANLTIAKALDDGQTSTTFFGTNQLVNAFNRRGEYGPSSFDIRRRFVTHFVWEPTLPLTTDGIVRAVFGGWRFSGVFTASSGIPLSGFLSGNLPASITTDLPFELRPTVNNPNGSGGANRTPFFQRNAFRGTPFATVDLRTSREIKLGERRRIEVLWEAFNLFNRVNFANFSTTQFNVQANGTRREGDTRIIKLSGDAGFRRPRAASTTIFGPREFQLGLKFLW